MSSFVLKIIAVITMFCDHSGYAIMGGFSGFNIIGRIAFPIFAFQISEGYKHTKNLKKYFERLLIFAIISQIPFHLFVTKFISSESNGLNIFFTLTLGLLCMILYDYFSNIENKELNLKLFNIELKKILGIFSVLLVAYIGSLLDVDYGFWGIIVIFSFHLFKNNKLAMIISFICLCVMRYGYYMIIAGVNLRYILSCIFVILPIVFIANYNNKQGHKIKYLLYLFYPLHLLLLYLFV